MTARSEPKACMPEPKIKSQAQSYERDLSNILILQSEVARTIAREVKAKLTPEEQTLLASACSVKPEAHELYLKGKSHYFKLTKEGCEKANEYFQQAIRIRRSPGWKMPTRSTMAGCLD